MPVAERGERRIHYTCTGSGPAVLLVPGLGSGARQFGTLPRRFERAGFTAAAIDPVGLPPSSPLPGDWTFADAAADLLAVAAQLPAPVTLVGTSLGAKVALCAAVPTPPRVHRLVLVGSTALLSARALRIYRWFELLATRAPADVFGELVAPFLFGASFQAAKPLLVDDIVRAMLPQPAAQAFMAAQARALAGFDGTPLARRCTLPTLCLGGVEDTLTPIDEVEATARLLPHGRCVRIEQAGHSLLLESTAPFEAILAFLREA